MMCIEYLTVKSRADTYCKIYMQSDRHNYLQYPIIFLNDRMTQKIQDLELRSINFLTPQATNKRQYISDYFTRHLCRVLPMQVVMV